MDINLLFDCSGELHAVSIPFAVLVQEDPHSLLYFPHLDRVYSFLLNLNRFYIHTLYYA